MNTYNTRPLIHPDLGMCESLMWSPDQTMILFSSQTMGICWINSRDNTLHRVVEYGIVGKCCWFWTINSIYILFNENGIVYRIDPDGSDREIVYSDSFYPGSMEYCSPLRQLTFNYEGIWIMDWPPEGEKTGQDET